MNQNKYCKEEIINLETKILLSLNFKLNPVTYDDCMNVIMHRWDSFLQEENSFSAKELQDFAPYFKKPALNSIMIYQQVCIIVDACLFWNNRQFNGLQIVSAIVYLVLKIFIGKIQVEQI